MTITILVLLCCAVRLLFIKSVDRFYLEFVYTPQDNLRQGQFFFSASGNYGLYKERLCWSYARKNYLLCVLGEILETNVAATTLRARGLSCVVSNVGHVCIMIRFASRAALLFPSAASEKNPLVPRAGGERYSFCVYKDGLWTNYASGYSRSNER